MISVQQAAPSLSCHNQAVSLSRYNSQAVFWFLENPLWSSSGSGVFEFGAAILAHAEGPLYCTVKVYRVKR